LFLEMPPVRLLFLLQSAILPVMGEVSLMTHYRAWAIYCTEFSLVCQGGVFIFICFIIFPEGPQQQKPPPAAKNRGRRSYDRKSAYFQLKVTRP
jgi:hypothetical protein